MSQLAPTTQDGIITNVPKEFVRKWWSDIEGTIPEEKVKNELNQAMLARIMAAQGSTKIEGLGQQAARINSRLFFRLQQQHGNAVHEWLPEYLKDNPHMCAKGYRPKVNPARHGLTGGWMPNKPAAAAQ
jgi:hypothetical protein